MAMYGVIGVPALCSMGAMTIGEFGVGWLVPFVVLILLPVATTLVMMALRSSMAQITVIDDELRIDNAVGVNLYSAPLEFLTALHPITFGAGPFTPTPGRMVIASQSTRPYVLDLRLWHAADVERLSRRLRDIPLMDEQTFSPKELKRQYPRVRLSWWHARPWATLLLLTALTAAYFTLAGLLFM
ncbi:MULTISPECIES: hypothetical protein [unclassified Streptomyces]|uniref:hypothetical protein n=1 Tax=unclassified Streptomyces TaxID=2593676 RepID=UPI0011610474|nr:hypothetical protein [Streptomyces sp. TSRI0281]